jgi:hypothetical protein
MLKSLAVIFYTRDIITPGDRSPGNPIDTWVDILQDPYGKRNKENGMDIQYPP